jgi:hypothetical protein
LAQAALPLPRLRAELHRVAPLPPPRQRVTHRFRRHLFARARCGAHAEIIREERTTRYHVERAFRLGA